MNSVAMLTITDSLNNFAFEVHQYLDSDSSGSTTNIVDAGIGATRLVDFTQWLKTNHRQGFLGEFSAANSLMYSNMIGALAISNMLTHVQTNSDVWLGWTWWSAGPWWWARRVSIEPGAGNSDQPTMGVLTNFAKLHCSPAAAQLHFFQGGNVVLSWPTNYSGFSLEYATNLPPTLWLTNPSPLQ